MKKLIYLVGVYSICAFVHDGINYAWEPIDILLKEKFKNRNSKNGERKPANLSSRNSDQVMDRIGF